MANWHEILNIGLEEGDRFCTPVAHNCPSKAENEKAEKCEFRSLHGARDRRADAADGASFVLRILCICSSAHLLQMRL